MAEADLDDFAWDTYWLEAIERGLARFSTTGNNPVQASAPASGNEPARVDINQFAGYDYTPYYIAAAVAFVVALMFSASRR